MLTASGEPLLDYDMATPNMLLHFFPTGILGLGLTALLASFMSGMAGNVTAFNTVSRTTYTRVTFTRAAATGITWL